MSYRKASRFSLFLVALLSLGLLLAACGDNNQTSPAQNSNLGYNSALAANFPGTTSLFVSLNTDQNSAQSLSAKKMIDYISAIPEIQDSLKSLNLASSTTTGQIDFEKDVRPWLGNEAAIGVTDMQKLGKLVGSLGSMTGKSSSSPTPTPNMAMASFDIPLMVAVQVKDKAKADVFVNKLLGSALGGNTSGLNIKPTIETYKDYTIYNLNLFVLQLSVAVGNDKLFLTLGSTAAKNAIDQTAGTSLSANAQYKAVAAKLPTTNLGFMYTDAASASSAMSAIPNMSQSTTSMNKDYLKGMGMAFSAADEGLKVDVYEAYDESKLTPEIKASLSKPAVSGKILEALPEKTFFFANGQDGKSAYDQLNSMLSQMPSDQTKQITDALTKFETNSGLSIQKDIAPLFAGEFAVFAVPSTTDQKVGVGFLTAVTDKASAQASLDKLAAALEKSPDATVKFDQKTFGGVTYKSGVMTPKDTTKNNGKSTTLEMGVAGNYVFISTASDQTEATITSATGGTNFSKGASYAEFTKVKASVPDSNKGYFFVDAQQAFAVAASMPSSPDNAKNQQQLTAISGKLTDLKSVVGGSKSGTTESNSTIYIHFPVK
ncbi:MAG: DUF3352 domain-containing protein [Chloroflexi bacterium]|uniref:DUF3352 domain-containing protein n=1 Tax=Candidatus Chlorohelix allophototropha TaxID=3003348 RepID=A0A8T7M1N6_9CHLR|nr:DUF3352 domain-containing protein [Chloroflexota bacterium]WJW67850.1 DUF3352 domain-containing protein [Chloroflexota bacterium L227-S17]